MSEHINDSDRLAIEAAVLAKQGTLTFPKLPNSVYASGHVSLYDAFQLQQYAIRYSDAVLATARDAEQNATDRAVRGLQALRIVLGIGSPETRGWAPGVQQEARRAIDRALTALTMTPVPWTLPSARDKSAPLGFNV